MWFAVTMELPGEVLFIIDALEAAGFEAYAVGGCVRDCLLGREPKDWDICTSALPAATMRVFARQPVIQTGLPYGTVTVMLNRKPFEVTTFRADGRYADSRRPDHVRFVSALQADLSRRDFTINALAYNPKTGVIDCFGGLDDLNARVIKCVGGADARFQEDALRILRALRFAAVLGFTIEHHTAKAMHTHGKRLSLIASERIAAELNAILLGDTVRDVCSEFIGVMSVFLPELTPAAGFQQNSRYHCYDVLDHTLYSIENAPKELMVRLTMLFHDLGKPDCYTEADGTGHFFGHARVSADKAREALTRLAYDNNTIKTVTALVLYHGCEIESGQAVKRWLNRLGEASFLRLMEVKKADAAAQAEPMRTARIGALNTIIAKTHEIIRERQCFSRKTLAVNGRDVLAAGIPEGKEVGAVLDRLLDMVIREEIDNDRDALLKMIRKR